MSYQIPLFDLNFDEAEKKAVIDVLNSKWISTGPKCLEFEQKFADMLNVKYALAVSNCTAALHLSALSLGIGLGDEVIVPSLTFVATINSIMYTGAKPIFCDITSKDDFSIDADKIEALITEKTKAITVMHYGGFSCDMNRIIELADKYNLRIIEDACHGPMSEYKRKKLGTIGDIGCFSFFSNKNISTAEGGILVTNNDDIYEKSKLIRSHGMTTMSYQRAKGHSTTYDVVEIGYNYRFNDILAGIGIVQLDKLVPDINKRTKIRKQYIELLKNEERIIIPYKDHQDISSSYIFSIVLTNGNVEKRNELRQYLMEKGIQTSVHYPPVHKFSVYKDYYRVLPLTEYVADNEVTLPMYGALSEDDVKYICCEVRKGLDKI